MGVALMMAWVVLEVARLVSQSAPAVPPGVDIGDLINPGANVTQAGVLIALATMFWKDRTKVMNFIHKQNAFTKAMCEKNGIKLGGDGDE